MCSPCDLIVCLFARKTLNSGGVKAQRDSCDDEQYKENQLNYSRSSDSDNHKPNKRQKFVRGRKPSSSQRRLLLCVTPGNITEEKRVRRNLGTMEADQSVMGSNINSWEQGLQRENTENEIEGDESSYADKRLVNERDINCRCFSDNEPQKNSEKDSSTTKRIKSESDVDIDEELAEQKLLLDETSTWIDIKQTKNETRNGCETCNRFCNGEKDNRVVCTAL